MSSTPLISCSSGAATVSAITLGFRPGYWARACTEGGTTSWYWLIGSCHTAMAPIRKMMIDSTAAKIGRSMKKRANRMLLASSHRELRLGELAGIHRDALGRDDDTWTDALQTVDDDVLARLQALLHDAQAVREPADFHRPIRDLVLGVDDVNELLALIGTDCTVIDQHGAIRVVAKQLDARE